jgi:nucleoside-diphosphate-sugar epimerase
MRQAFISGGSGFVGRNLIAALRERGVAVRCLARSATSAQAVRQAGGEPVSGDLEDSNTLREGLKGCDAVFHTAAIVKDWGDPQEFHRVNVQGTENLLAAARAAGVPCMVHVSTEAVLAGPAPLVAVDETLPRPREPYGPYSLTKGLAEERVLSANAATLRTVVVRPRFIWGKGDTSVLPQLVAAVRAGRFRWISGGRYLTSATHVSNVCEALILAAERGRGGEIYFATDGPPIEFRKFVTALLETQGVRPGRRSLPRSFAFTLAKSIESIWTALHIKAAPPITRMVVKMMGEEVTLNDSKARRELGYSGRISFEEGIRRMRDLS